MYAHCLIALVFACLMFTDAMKYCKDNPCSEYLRTAKSVLTENRNSPDFPDCTNFTNQSKEIQELKAQMHSTCDKLEMLKLKVKLTEKWATHSEKSIQEVKNCFLKLREYVKEKSKAEPSEECDKYAKEIEKYQQELKGMFCGKRES